jgi:hypothetical protein
MKLNHITVGHDYYGNECLHVWGSPEEAQTILDDSPVSDGYSMSSTTFHRPAKISDVWRLKYDRDGNPVEVED